MRCTGRDFTLPNCFADAHTEAVQLALAKHQSNRLPALPIPVKRRSLMFHNSVDESSGELMAISSQ